MAAGRNRALLLQWVNGIYKSHIYKYSAPAALQGGKTLIHLDWLVIHLDWLVLHLQGNWVLTRLFYLNEKWCVWTRLKGLKSLFNMHWSLCMGIQNICWSCWSRFLAFFKAKKFVIYRNGTRQQWQMWFSQFIKSDNIRRGFNIPRGEMQMCLLVVSFTRKGRHTYCYHVSASSSLYQHLPSFIVLGLCGISNVLLIGEVLFCSIE